MFSSTFPTSRYLIGVPFQASNVSMSSELRSGMSVQGSANNTTGIGFSNGLLMTSFLPKGDIDEIIVDQEPSPDKSPYFTHNYSVKNGNKYKEITHVWEIPFDGEIKKKMQSFSNNPSSDPVTIKDFFNGMNYTVTYGTSRLTFSCSINVKGQLVFKLIPSNMKVTQPGYRKSSVQNSMIFAAPAISAGVIKSKMRTDLDAGEVREIIVLQLEDKTFRNSYTKTDGSSGGLAESSAQWDIPFEEIKPRLEQGVGVTKGNFFSGNKYTYVSSNGKRFTYSCIIMGQQITFTIVNGPTKLSSAYKFGMSYGNTPVNHPVSNTFSPFIGSTAHTY